MGASAVVAPPLPTASGPAPTASEIQPGDHPCPVNALERAQMELAEGEGALAEALREIEGVLASIDPENPDPAPLVDFVEATAAAAEEAVNDALSRTHELGNETAGSVNESIAEAVREAEELVMLVESLANDPENATSNATEAVEMRLAEAVSEAGMAVQFAQHAAAEAIRNATLMSPVIVWTNLNHGTGSCMDADLLDGFSAEDFIQHDAGIIDKLDQEIADRIAGDSALASDLAQEANARTAGDTYLNSFVRDGNLLGRDLTLAATNGIRFPANPFGGSGDQAAIKVENMGGDRSALVLESQNDGVGSSEDSVVTRAAWLLQRPNAGGGGNFHATGQVQSAGPLVALSHQITDGNTFVRGDAQVNGRMTVGDGIQTARDVLAGGAIQAWGDVIASDDLIASDDSFSGWFFSRGNQGWWSLDHGSGIAMNDPNWIQVLNGRNFWVPGQTNADSLKARSFLNAPSTHVGVGNTFVQLGSNRGGCFAGLNDDGCLYDPQNGYIYLTTHNGGSWGNLGVGNFFATGSKSFIQEHPGQPDTKLQYYSLEGPSSDIFHRGKGQLADGIATIELPSSFSALASGEMTVSVTPTGPSEGLYVPEGTLGPNGFEVRENPGGSGEVPFHYVVYAERLGFEDAPVEQPVTVSEKVLLSRTLTDADRDKLGQVVPVTDDRLAEPIRLALLQAIHDGDAERVVALLSTVDPSTTIAAPPATFGPLVPQVVPIDGDALPAAWDEADLAPASLDDGLYELEPPVVLEPPTVFDSAQEPADGSGGIGWLD